MKRLYNISYYRPWQTPQFPESVDQVLNSHGEWIRISANVWFIWSGSTQLEITTALQPIAATNDQCIITVITPEVAQGFAPQWIWNWLNDKMHKQFRGDS